MNKGFNNEISISNALNKKCLKEIQFKFLRECIYKLYPHISDDDIIYCMPIQSRCKADLCIFVNDITNCKYVSVKFGDSISVHEEDVFEFCKFLRDIGVSDASLKMLLFYQFGDGTLDGSGGESMELNMLKAKYSNFIKNLNDEINKKEILLKVFNRVLFKNKNDFATVDYILYGNKEIGYLASKEEIVLYFLSQRKLHILTPHFGPLLFQAYSRNSHKKSRKMKMQLKWRTIFSDMQKICSD